MSEETIRVILPLSRIRPGKIVTKLNGKVRYKVAVEIPFYGEDREPIRALDGTKFLIPVDTSSLAVNVYPGEKEFVVELTLWEVRELLDPDLRCLK